jgi:hypothetical protein
MVPWYPMVPKPDKPVHIYPQVPLLDNMGRFASMVYLTSPLCGQEFQEIAAMVRAASCLDETDGWEPWVMVATLRF